MLAAMLPALLLAVGLFAPQSPPTPATAAEASGFTATSRLADVERFCRSALDLPHGDRLTLLEAGRSHGDRPLLLVQARLPGPAPTPRRLRALVIGAIHGGEIEGKEALQQLVREIALGEHEQLLAHVELWLLPIYNVDGNEAVAVGNRAGQNGPDACGQRANGQDLDLNRDFVKADAPETRALLRLFTEVDPDLFVDLHTTNGSYHGYHLTFAPSLQTNVDAAVAAENRALLDAAQAAMRERFGFATFDYGNFETHDWDGGGAPESAAGVRGWYTFDHRTRYGVNYFGLRNRLAVLSEAYSYCDFATRTAATHAFVVCVLQALVARRDAVQHAADQADARALAGTPPLALGYATGFAEPEPMDVLVGEVEREEPADGRPLRFVRKGNGVPERLPVVRAFRSAQQRPLPAAWAIAAPIAAVRDRLALHGIEFEPLAAPRTVRAQTFAVDKKKKPKRPYQGHQELVLEGSWSAAAEVSLPAGALWVPARQRLARLAAVLLEPESEDSLSNWNFFEAETDTHYPVLRVVDGP